MKKEIEIFKAVNSIADFLKIEPQEVVSHLTFLMKEENKNKIISAYNDTVKFYELPFKERAEKMGYSVSENKKGIETSEEL